MISGTNGHFGTKISLETENFGANPVLVKGGNSAENNNNVCVSACLIKQFMYDLVSRNQ